jgi:hypothetical protein
MFSASFALADVLVLKDGTFIPTQGPWEIDGQRVLYTNTSGNRTLIRLSRVDVPASRANHDRTDIISVDRPASAVERPPEVDLVTLSKRQDPTKMGIVLSKTSGVIRLGEFAEQIGVQFPETGPDARTVDRTRELMHRYLHRVLAASAKYDLTRPRIVQLASTDLKKISLDAGRLAQSEDDAFLKQKLREVEKAILSLASMAEQNPNRFAELMKPYVVPESERDSQTVR